MMQAHRDHGKISRVACIDSGLATYDFSGQKHEDFNILVQEWISNDADFVCLAS